MKTRIHSQITPLSVVLTDVLGKYGYRRRYK